MALLIVIHVIVCVALIGIILIQRGRGGGFVDSFQGLETVFGTKTSAFLTKSTTVLASLFFITCLSLAFFSLRQSRSLIRATSPISPPVENATGAQSPAGQQSQQQQQQQSPAVQPQAAAPSAQPPQAGTDAAVSGRPNDPGE